MFARDDDGPWDGDDVEGSFEGRVDAAVLGDREEYDGLVMVVVVLRLEVEMNRLNGGGCGWAGVADVDADEEGCALDGDDWDDWPLEAFEYEEGGS